MLMMCIVRMRGDEILMRLSDEIGRGREEEGEFQWSRKSSRLISTPPGPLLAARERGTSLAPSTRPTITRCFFFARRLPQSRSFWWCCLSHASVE